jgi:hypothetical protein
LDFFLLLPLPVPFRRLLPFDLFLEAGLPAAAKGGALACACAGKGGAPDSCGKKFDKSTPAAKAL